MIFVDENLSELAGRITITFVHCNEGKFPTKYQTYDQLWENLFFSISNLKDDLGIDLSEQIVDMASQAKLHYENNDTHWASWLMQDIKQIVQGKPPFAYPKDMYRWPKIRLVK